LHKSYVVGLRLCVFNEIYLLIKKEEEEEDIVFLLMAAELSWT
jgi:hypothetical protein